MNGPFDIMYRPRGRFPNGAVGAHSASAVGGVGLFRDLVPFLRYPDARRIDIRATLRDPFGETYVRRFEQRASVDLYAIVDLSASMGFSGAANKLALASEICASMAFSATRVGDQFGLIACDRAIRRELFLPATRSRTAALRAAEELRLARCESSSAEGCLDGAALLGARRKIVLLISDFRWPLALAESIFEHLRAHDVVPIVMGDSVEETPPRWGLFELADLESAQRRLVVMRPKLRRQWIEREAIRQKTLRRLAVRYGRAPFLVRDRVNPDELTRHLTAG